jgi:transmembrane sensor
MSRPIPDIATTDNSPRAAAIAWFSRRRSGLMTDADEAALRTWLDDDPAHREAWLEVRGAWLDLDAVNEHPGIAAMREQLASGRKPVTRRSGARRLAASLAFAVVMLSGIGVWQWGGAPHPLANRTFATALGQRTTVTLPDGSQLTLNTDTVVRTRVDHERRLVYLDKGQAFFKVAHDRRHPFVVTAAGRTITALGTEFDVRVDRGVFKVTLLEGKVRVESIVRAPRVASGAGHVTSPARLAVQATEMTPGSQLVAPGDGEWRLIQTDAVAESSWTRGQLIFDDVPLKDVVAELNRYSHIQVVVPGEGLRNTPISGNFRPGDVDGFVYALEQFHLARGVRASDDTVELRPIS